MHFTHPIYTFSYTLVTDMSSAGTFSSTVYAGQTSGMNLLDTVCISVVFSKDLVADFFYRMTEVTILLAWFRKNNYLVTEREMIRLPFLAIRLLPFRVISLSATRIHRGIIVIVKPLSGRTTAPMIV